ncbi:MAG: glycosyltransferase family 39 protein [Nocardioidaceae bacterium]|nr:glycosyltransferase family 39 protein [Nocardioidaceae bacterium]
MRIWHGDTTDASARSGALIGADGLWYVGATVTGAVLITVTALNQPFNQNELAQMAPYGSDDLSTIASGTRQPPLDPWLGSLVQHLLGEGQLRQRLVPVVAGIGALLVMAFLLRRLGLGLAGAFGIWLMATAPLMVRYSAYTRPYALPLFLMILFVYAAMRWLDVRSKAWLTVAGVAAVCLPLSRVPEPTAFLMTTMATLCWLCWRRRLAWSAAWPVVAIAGAAMLAVGYPMFRSLKASASGYYDPSPAGIVNRFPDGAHEIATGLLPLLGSWLPWWPISVLVLISALLVPASRRRLAGWWFVWPLLAAPVAFALAYHFVAPVDFTRLPYRARAAIFFVPAFVLVVSALAAAVADAANRSRTKVALAALLGAALVGQLPVTARALWRDDSPDFARVGEMLDATVPEDGIVLYDRPAGPDDDHMGFLAPKRYLEDSEQVVETSQLAHQPRRLSDSGPIYLLVNGQCTSGSCGSEPVSWDDQVAGWHIKARLERFTLYAPSDGQSGRNGAIAALRSLGHALGPEVGFRQTFAAAALLQRMGHAAEGDALVQQMYADADAETAALIREAAERKGLDPFR